MMTLEEIEARLEDIERSAKDSEMAHGLEDDLYIDFVQHVAQMGPPELAEMAKAVLRSQQLDFPRLCA